MQLLKNNINFLLLTILVFSSCNGNEEGMTLDDNFDRKEMLTFWTDELIIPAFENYNSKLQVLDNAADEFFNIGDESSYDTLVDAWLSAYVTWQSVSMYDIGKAEEVKLRNFTNIFPVDTSLVNSNLASQNYNLTLPSNYDAQGFPALDYLLFGLSEDKLKNISILSEPDYAQYFTALVANLNTLTQEVLDDWKTTYRSTFIENSGSSATASVDKLVNDFIFYYEKYFRAGKVGIPAGVFSGAPISISVEAPYSKVYSKTLWKASFEAIKNFFNGVPFDSGTEGLSIKSYLQHVRNLNQTNDIAHSITKQWDAVESNILGVDDDFKNQVETDNSKMLALYDELQKAVVLLKVDMMQALNIQVDFVDADGD